MRFGILDPRPIPAAQVANDVIFNLGQVLGVEVTVPALASRCGLGNIDPQHNSNGDASRAAIEVAINFSANRLVDDLTVVTVRPDLDSVGSMAVLSLRAQGISINGATGRIRQVADADKFARGGWPGVRPLPTTASPWNDSASAESSRPLAAIAAAIADYKVPIGDRVATMEKWLITGEEPAAYRAQVECERREMIAALESGAIKHETHCNGRIAVVESTHRAATSVGYSLAPVVVALNPSFRIGGGEPHRKFTICAFEPRFADIKSALAELAAIEPGWGGSPTIGGSPQGVSSKLTIDKVVEVLSRHLK